jgi:hypothetical protein
VLTVGDASVRVEAVREATLTAVEIGMGKAGMLSAAVSVTSAVRVFKLASWAAALLTTPVATWTVHQTPAGIVAVPAVSVSLALLVLEFVALAANVAVPQPVVVGVANDASTNEGSTSDTESPLDTGVFEMNLKDRVVAPPANALLSTRLLAVRAGSTMAGDAAMAVAGTLAPAAMEIDTLKLGLLAAAA